MQFFSCFLTSLLGSQAVVEHSLADAQAFGGDLEQLIIGEELQTILEAHDPRRHQTERIIRTGCTGVGQVLSLADLLAMLILSAIFSSLTKYVFFM